MSREFKDPVMSRCSGFLTYVARDACCYEMTGGRRTFCGEYIELRHDPVYDDCKKYEKPAYGTCLHELEIRYLSDNMVAASQALNIVCDRSDFFKNIFGDILDGTHTANMDFKLDSFNVVKRDDGVTVYQMYIDDVECSVETIRCMEVFFTLLCMDPVLVIEYILGLQVMNGIWSNIRLIRNGAFEVYKLADYYQYTDLCLLLETNMQCIFYNEIDRYYNLFGRIERYTGSRSDLVRTGFLRYDAKQVEEYLESTGNGERVIHLTRVMARQNEESIRNGRGQCKGGFILRVNERDLARLDELVRANRASETVNPIVRMNDKGEWRILNFLELRKR